jgi:putative ABC transport system ATP-binding protein
MIRLENVSRYYESSRCWAVRGVTLEAGRGELVLVRGPSGSGKTTLLNLIGGLDRPTEGAVRVGGQALGALGERGLSRLRNGTIGFIFQTYYVHGAWSVLENVALPLVIAGVARRERKERALAVLERLGMAALSGQSAATLSGGQKQRVVIARALVTRPAVLLADEPVANLDDVLAAEVTGLLRELADGGTTVVAVAHGDWSGVRADRRLELRDGRLTA